jgi:hypothetical protein
MNQDQINSIVRKAAFADVDALQASGQLQLPKS